MYRCRLLNGNVVIKKVMGRGRSGYGAEKNEALASAAQKLVISLRDDAAEVLFKCQPRLRSGASNVSDAFKQTPQQTYILMRMSTVPARVSTFPDYHKHDPNILNTNAIVCISVSVSHKPEPFLNTTPVNLAPSTS